MIAIFPSQSLNSVPNFTCIFSLVLVISYAELIFTAKIFITLSIHKNISILTDSALTTPDHISSSGSLIVTLLFSTSLSRLLL